MSYIHYKMNDYFRNASFGMDYKELDRIYPKWSSELHINGNTTSSDNLRIIANNGIIHWYCKKIINDYDIDYPLFERINAIKNNPLDMSYYDWVIICQLCRIFNIQRHIFEDYNFNTGWKYKFIQTNFPKELELNLLIFSKILIKKYSIIELNTFILYFYDKIKVLELYFTCGTFFQTFLTNNLNISDLGISFQRIKILIEKMQVICCDNKDIDISNFNPDIYKYDNFCDDIQECIYSYVKNYINNFLEKNKPKIINIDELSINLDKVRFYIEPVPNDNIYNIRL